MKFFFKKIIFVSVLFFCIFFLIKKTLAVDIPASASRTSGVAPLSVHFNADLTASSPTERSFHDLEYSWNFGDPSAGNWGTDGLPKNTDKGPVSAHVYETPGTFSAVLTVRDATGIIDTETFTITVTDPDVVFAGTKTTCISDSAHNDFTGCPVGASHVTTDNLSGIGAYADAGERALLRRGDSWTLNDNISFQENTGPVHIGAYGACSNPDALGICNNAPSITVTGSGPFIDLNYKHDWRITNLAIAGAKTVPFAIFGAVDIQNTLVSRLKIIGFQTPFELTHWRENDTDYFDNNSIVSSSITDSGVNLVYLGGERTAVIGSILQNTDQSHILRFWHAHNCLIGHNLLSGTSLIIPDGRHALKLHGQIQSNIGTYAQTGSEGIRNHTQFVVVTNNVFGTSGPWPVSAGPQDDSRDERVSDIIFEKNKFLANYGIISAIPVQVGLMFEGRYFTVRNNIFDGTGSANGYTGIYVARRGVEWTPLGNNVYNNTIYSQSTYDNQAVGVEVHVDADLTTIRNNLISFPNTSWQGDIVNQAGAETISSNNSLTNTPYFTDPDNASPLLRNFFPTSQSTEAIDQGTIVPVFDDFFGNPRTGAYDIGAHEYVAGGDIIAPSAPTGLGTM